jgi:hypothetical protein
MSDYMLVRHKVKDFSAWKPLYDGNLPMRKEYGITEKYLTHSDSDPNEVVVLFEAADLARAKAFAESDDLHKVMEKAGVIDKPDIIYLHE